MIINIETTTMVTIFMYVYLIWFRLKVAFQVDNKRYETSFACYGKGDFIFYENFIYSKVYQRNQPITRYDEAKNIDHTTDHPFYE